MYMQCVLVRSDPHHERLSIVSLASVNAESLTLVDTEAAVGVVW